MQNTNLINRIKEQDEDAFNEIYYKYNNLVYYVILKIVGNREDASDVMEDTFLKMYRNINQYNGGNFKYWLLQIAKHEALNYATRVQAKRKELALDENLIADIPSNTFSLGKYDDLLRYNFDKETRTIIILKVVFDYSFNEIAEELKINKSFAYRSYKLAMQKLKKLMEVK